MASPSPRDLVARNSLRASRDRALTAVAEIYTTDRAELDLALYDAIAANETKDAEIAGLREELAAARKRIFELENPDTPAL